MWGLVIIDQGRVAELQRWSQSEQLDSQGGPKSVLQGMEVKGEELIFYYRKGRAHWNLGSGSFEKVPYEEDESLPELPVPRIRQRSASISS